MVDPQMSDGDGQKRRRDPQPVCSFQEIAKDVFNLDRAILLHVAVHGRREIRTAGGQHSLGAREKRITRRIPGGRSNRRTLGQELEHELFPLVPGE